MCHCYEHCEGDGKHKTPAANCHKCWSFEAAARDVQREWTKEEWGEVFTTVQHMKRGELLAYTRKLEKFAGDVIDEYEQYRTALFAASQEGVGFPPWVDERIARRLRLAGLKPHLPKLGA